MIVRQSSGTVSRPSSVRVTVRIRRALLIHRYLGQHWCCWTALLFHRLVSRLLLGTSNACSGVTACKRPLGQRAAFPPELSASPTRANEGPWRQRLVTDGWTDDRPGDDR